MSGISSEKGAKKNRFRINKISIHAMDVARAKLIVQSYAYNNLLIIYKTTERTILTRIIVVIGI